MFRHVAARCCDARDPKIDGYAMMLFCLVAMAVAQTRGTFTYDARLSSSHPHATIPPLTNDSSRALCPCSSMVRAADS